MTPSKDPRYSWAEETPVDMDITVTSAQLATMYPSNRIAEACVYELEGPPQSYFEFPLDWFIDQDGHVQPSDFPGAIRLIQRVHYKSFCLVGDTSEDVMRRTEQAKAAVRTELKKQAEISYIWWRLYPKYELQGLDLETGKKPARHRVRLRLGTLPVLPSRFWLDLSKAVDNVSSEPLVPRE